jgi:hypothetical protein
MRLPFVSRSIYDAMCLDKTARIIDLRTEVAELRKRESEWASRIMALSAPPSPPVPLQRTNAPDEVMEAIVARSGTNRSLRTHLARWAMSQRAAKVPDEEILQRVTHWSSESDEESGPMMD